MTDHSIEVAGRTRNGITAPPVTTDLTPELSRTDYREDPHPPVTLYTVHGGGHTVPGRTPSPALMGRTTDHLHTPDAIAAFFAF
jgi:polyhydroxybutyrate depolymerase